MKQLFKFLLFLYFLVGLTACGNKDEEDDTPPVKPTIEVENITLGKTEIALDIQQSELIKAVVLPENAVNKTVTWRTSDSYIAIVEDGLVKGQAEGTAIITATAGSKSATCKVVVVASFFTFGEKEMFLFRGVEKTIDVNAYPAELGKNIIWSSSDPSVATVNNKGVVKGVAPGNTVITAKSDNKTADCKVVVDPDIYMTGLYNVYLWKNGKEILPEKETKDISTTSVFVAGDDVYVAGKSNGVATLWKNGKELALNGANLGSLAYSVYVSGNDVYVAGTLNDNGYNSKAALWKNGMPVTLENLNEKTMAKSVFVSGNDVYVAGTSLDRNTYKTKATLWKNGKAVFLTDGSVAAEVSALFVSGDDVYIAGYLDVVGLWGQEAVLWKNKQASILGLSGEKESVKTSSVVVSSNNDVYVTGSTFANREGYLWKNGKQEKKITYQGSNITTVLGAVWKDDFYLVAFLYNFSDESSLKVWRNNEAYGDFKSPASLPPTSIFVH